MLSAEALVIVAYWDEAEAFLLCRSCGERERLSCEQAETLYAVEQILENRLPDTDYEQVMYGPDAVYCDQCDAEIYRPICLTYLREWAD